MLCFVSDDYCFTGWEIKNYGVVDINFIWHTIAPTMNVTCHGTVTEWKYLVRTAGPFKALIERPVAGSDTEFSIVGINEIQPDATNQQIVFPVPLGDRIAVRTGDVLGWGYADPGPLIWTLDGILSASVRRIPAAGYSVGQVSNFIDEEGFREYSIEATIVCD